MRNLKKILALVLALVMVVGMMTVASAATPGTKFVDDADITKYDEAVQVLAGLGIYKGTDNKAFNPNETITRAEVAALVYRVVTGDVTDTHVGIYADYNQFADVASDAWYAGYVNFCANAKLLMGDGTNFYPMEKVTGYQVLAIMLRVIGYGQEGEYEGTNWHIRTASKAAELDITKNIVAGTLGAYSTRAMVAEMIYRAIAQTETVTYNRINLYNGTEKTYAYQQFGLYGKGQTSYQGMTTRYDATADAKYGEPVAYWQIKGADANAIVIRFNPVLSAHNYVTKGEVYAATGKTAFNGYEDGVNNTFSVSIDKTSKTDLATPVANSGNGVVTEVFVADGTGFVVVKNTYVDYAKVTNHTAAGHKHVNFVLSQTTIDLEAAQKCTTTTLADGTVVLYNMYNGYADYATIHAAPAKNVTVSYTYDKGVADYSYFIGTDGVKYTYASTYNTALPYTGALGNRVPQVILNRDEVTLDIYKWAANYFVGGAVYDEFDKEQVVYFDDFGNVIHTYDKPVFAAANEKGYVFVRSAAYGGQIADNRWVSNYTVITADGQAATIKGATNANGYWTTQYEASDADYNLGLYAYEIVNGYYALYKVDATTSSHIINKVIDSERSMTEIYAGDADAIVVSYGAVLDDSTMFIIANYDATGMITGYSCVKGFKNIPDLKGALDVEFVVTKAEDGYDTIELVLVLGAKQSADIAGPGLKDTVIYLADTTPEDYVETYDTHKVIANGVAGTMQFVNNTVYDSNATTNKIKYNVGFYTVKEVQWGTNYVVTLDSVNTVEGAWRADGVLKAGTDLVALNDSCVFYQISGESVKAITEADLAKMGTVTMVVAATDGFGYATVIYVIDK